MGILSTKDLNKGICPEVELMFSLDENEIRYEIRSSCDCLLEAHSHQIGSDW